MEEHGTLDSIYTKSKDQMNMLLTRWKSSLPEAFEWLVEQYAFIQNKNSDSVYALANQLLNFEDKKALALDLYILKYEATTLVLGLSQLEERNYHLETLRQVEAIKTEKGILEANIFLKDRYKNPGKRSGLFLKFKNKLF